MGLALSREAEGKGRRTEGSARGIYSSLLDPEVPAMFAALKDDVIGLDDGFSGPECQHRRIEIA